MSLSQITVRFADEVVQLKRQIFQLQADLELAEAARRALQSRIDELATAAVKRELPRLSDKVTFRHGPAYGPDTVW